MPNLKDIRRRIRSVQSTQQITKAMKMVAAAKLRRAQESMMAARPYAAKMLEVLNSLATRSDRESHPILAVRPEKKIRVIVVAADRGLCGAFNTNILRFAFGKVTELSETSDSIIVDSIGRKSWEYFKRRNFDMGEKWSGLFKKVRYEDAREVAEGFIAKYTREDCDAVYLVYNRFKSMIAQQVVLERLLPIPRLKATRPEVLLDYLYEPTEQELFENLLPRHVSFQVFHAILESGAAEQAARMTAMGNATTNARDMIDSMTLYANRVRQAAITKEIIEVVSGAQALG